MGLAFCHGSLLTYVGFFSYMYVSFIHIGLFSFLTFFEGQENGISILSRDSFFMYVSLLLFIFASVICIGLFSYFPFHGPALLLWVSIHICLYLFIFVGLFHTCRSLFISLLFRTAK